MSPEVEAILVFAGMVACLMAGYYLGFDWGRKTTMTRKEAARVMAKAMHTKRREKAYVPIWQRFGGNQ